MSVEDEIDRILDFTSVGLTSLEVLLFPIEEVAEATEADLGVLKTASKVLAGVGVLSILGSVGMLYHRNAKIPLIIKWLLVPLIIVHVAVILSLFGLLGFGQGGLKKGLEFGLKYVKPIAYSLMGVAIIPLMAIFPEKLFNVKYIGKVIYYIPAGLGIPPINKQPYYAIVILVRAGGLITSLAGEIIELAAGGEKENVKELPPGQDPEVGLA
ncbi:hypothetical protein PBT90_08680 [Algoriphagus halophytocola]|uniref:Uncharacterized protein n=1 Tax=Algoriphagus halophytocola TaxID=2991499 RepID=A0ABY6MLA9_9BACT|nr:MULTISPECIES: hypothetical protein [unclassified Algoriphagus]UZD23461.1 hypothetical protein OM944_03000 [Algoriphagus sp. TR-M5]WBL44756.1 hypothetical protein PBT90_08680 [Algoriphagus sp. TR-M9]